MARRGLLFLLTVGIVGLLAGCGFGAPPAPPAATMPPTPTIQRPATKPSAVPPSPTVALPPRIAPTIVVATPAPTATMAPTATATVAVTALKVYFNNDKLAGASEVCAKVFPVTRTVPKTPAVATAALTQLFAGPTKSEAAQGYTSMFSDKTKGILKSIKIVDAVAYVNLTDLRSIIPNASTSCGAAMLLNEMDSTLKQFSTIKKTVYAIDGKPRTFYTWLQVGCGPENDHCDETPFKPPTGR